MRKFRDNSFDSDDMNVVHMLGFSIRHISETHFDRTLLFEFITSI